MDKMNSTGRVFQRIYRDRKGNLQKTSTWLVKYRIGDKPITIATGTQGYQEAAAILRQKIATVTPFAMPIAPKGC